jgi:hypothetical protein
MKSVLRALAANVETAGSVPRVAMPHSDFGDRN